VRSPTREEAAALNALLAEQEEVEARLQAEVRRLRTLCEVPVGARLDAVHLLWVDSNGRPVE
jgi:hypothetical protein